MVNSSTWLSGVVIGVIVLCFLLYAGLFFAGCRGYGYPGAGGYDSGPSFWYFGGVPTYHDPSVRGGSAYGPDVTGGGTHDGK